MRTARLQTNDLGRADHFFGALLSKQNVKEVEKPPVVEATKAPQVNGGSLVFRGDAKPRFSDPPAPPPQQPLPEKPDVARSHPFDPSSPSLKRTNTERPRSIPNSSPIRQDSPASQIIPLAEALASARKEIESQSARMRDLEEMLQKETQARKLAEEVAKRLELRTSESKANGHAKAENGSIIEEAFEPPSEAVKETEEPDETKAVDTKSISDSTVLLEQRLETMLNEMKEMREQMESFKQRAETAESERDADRKTLVEMVEKIRSDESNRRSSSTERARSPPNHLSADNLSNGSFGTLDALDPLLEKTSISNGKTIGSREETEFTRSAVGALSRSSGHDPLLYHTAPYASMLGVVLLGMGVMAYLNGWQPPKVDR